MWRHLLFFFLSFVPLVGIGGFVGSEGDSHWANLPFPTLALRHGCSL